MAIVTLFPAEHSPMCLSIVFQNIDAYRDIIFVVDV